jgi:hypothetical protein
VLGRLPIDPELASLCDKGEIEKFSGDYLNKAVSVLEKDLEPEIKFKKGH